MQVQSNDDPIMDAVAVTPNDGANLPSGVLGRYLFVGTAGHVRVTTVHGSDVTLKNAQNGSWHKIAVLKVWATGTTATDIVVGW